MFKHTKIVATIGPACYDVKILEQMIKSGVNVARLNFSHGSHDDHSATFAKLRAIESRIGLPITIMQDLQGPKIRLGVMPEEGLKVSPGDQVVLNTAIKEYNGKELPFVFPGMEKHLKPKERLLIDDGKFEMKIKKVQGTKIYCQAVNAHILKSKKGFNFPDSHLPIAILSDKDKDDLRLGVKLGVDLVALSFVHTAQNILDIKKLIKKYEAEMGIVPEQPIGVIAKIERPDAVKNIKEILEVSDGVMIARGDLAMEVKWSELPLIQKRIVDLANSMAKPVIVATQMLDSMQTNFRPTRAEITDVANAVIDHADALMLSNETASGDYPLQVVKTMAEIIETTEMSEYDDTNLPPVHKEGTTVHHAIAEMSRMLAEEVKAKLILAASITGETGRLISHVRPSLPILVATSNMRSLHQLNLSWGVFPFIMLPCKTIDELLKRAMQYVVKNKLAKKGDNMVVVAGEPVGQAGNVNLVEVKKIK